MSGERFNCWNDAASAVTLPSVLFLSPIREDKPPDKFDMAGAAFNILFIPGMDLDNVANACGFMFAWAN